MDPWLVQATLNGACGELIGTINASVIEGVATFDIAVKGLCPEA